LHECARVFPSFNKNEEEATQLIFDIFVWQNNNRSVLREQVRKAFKANMYETDPGKIEAMRQSAIQGLSNYMFYEAQRMVKVSLSTAVSLP